MQHSLFTKSTSGKVTPKRRKPPVSLLWVALVLVFTLTLTACGANTNNSADSKGNNEPAATAQATAEPDSTNEQTAGSNTDKDQTKTIKHDFGESVIPAHPKRIVSIGMEDMLLSLDVPMVQAFSTDGYYLDKQLKDKGIAINSSFDINLEAVTAADPDLIIMNKYMTDEQGYEQLSKIAPTIAFIRDDWQTGILEIGKALDKEDEAKNVLKAYQDKVQQAQATIKQAVGENKTVAFIRPTTKDVELDFPEYVWTSVLYNELGLKPDPEVLKIASTTTDTWGGTMLSLEMLPKLSADYLFMDYGASMSSEDEFQQSVRQAAEVEKLSIWKSIPAVQKGNVHQVSARHWALNGPIADSLKVDDVVNALTGSK
ncbi:ABC transporter substrate-binding protein [Paenibacillus sp. NPDC056722]|uniref:ABC transporter substrate-binding protein n=1 Tax=Paenibacillus sp. NPDC056722 TaxID=3345924 RepID=UPI00369CCFFF